jgi:hypothetical protein
VYLHEQVNGELGEEASETANFSLFKPELKNRIPY